MIVDGRAIATQIYQAVAADVANMGRAPVLAAVTCDPNFETKKYLGLKKRKAAEVGITLKIIELPKEVTTSEVQECIKELLPVVDGIVVQLPFPSHINREEVLVTVPPDKDPDGFSYGVSTDSCLPPVTGAILEIAAVHDVVFEGKRVVVLGQGRLVGAPIIHYLHSRGIEVKVLTERDGDPAPYLREADVIISGIGKPHMIESSMVKPGVVVFDAGTSEEGGVIAGDVHPQVADKATLFTPVPGGIGPITVAVLLRNLVTLINR